MSLLVRPSRRRFLGLSAAAMGAAMFGGTPARANPVHGGTVTFVSASEPPVLSALAHTAINTVYVSGKTNEGLLTYDFDLNPRPQLATEWSISPDGLVYTFKLRQGVKWHDGKPFTSADVAYSIATIKEVHPRGRNTFANLADTLRELDLRGCRVTAPAERQRIQNLLPNTTITW